MKDYFFSRERLFRLSRVRVVYFITFAATFVLTEIGRQIYRPYIYRHGIKDFGLADVVGNLLGTVAIIFMALGLYHATRLQSRRIIAFITIGVAIYELLQRVLPRGVLDWKDVGSTFIAGLLAWVLVLGIWRVVKDDI